MRANAISPAPSLGVTRREGAAFWRRPRHDRRSRAGLPALVFVAVVVAAGWPASAGESGWSGRFDFSGSSFSLDTDQGQVEVRGSSSGEVRIRVDSRLSDFERYFDVRVDDSGDRLEIRLERKGKLPRWLGGPRVAIDVEVPRSTAVEIDTAGGAIEIEGTRAAVRLSTSGGSIDARDLAGPLDAETSGGGVSISQVDGDVETFTSGGSIQVSDIGGQLTAKTSGGPIAVERVDGDVRAETSGGSIRLEQIGGSIEADTSGGSVTAVFTAGNGRGGSLSTSGGGVKVYVDPSVDLRIDASTSGGSIIADVPLTVQGKVSKSRVIGNLGQGGPLLRLRASGGTIRIGPR